MIVAFGTYDAARHPRVAVIVAGLRAHGYEVLEANRPLGLSTADRVRILQQPWRLGALVVRLLRCWALLAVDAIRLRRRRGAPEAVVVGYLGHFDVFLARLLYPRTTLVLDHLIFAGDTASDRGAAGLRVRLLNLLDRLATACADIVVVDTEEHLRMLPEPAKGVVVPVGASEGWFAAGDAAAGTPVQGEDRAPGGMLSAVFFGLFTPLQGTAVLADAVARAVETARAAGGDLSLTMVGSGQDHAAVRTRLADVPGITWLEWVEPSSLPELVARHDVCLGIFGDTPKALRVVPNKVYQGLAAGCVVLTSDTPPQRRLLGEHLELVPPADPAALADRLLALMEPRALDAARHRTRSGRDGARPAEVVRPLVAVLAGRSRRLRAAL